MAITPGGRVGDASPLGKGKRKLSDYEREVAHALMRKGHSKQRAIMMARGIIRNAATRGKWGRGHVRNPAVAAGAAASIAQRKSFANTALGDVELAVEFTPREVDLAKPGQRYRHGWIPIRTGPTSYPVRGSKRDRFERNRTPGLSPKADTPVRKFGMSHDPKINEHPAVKAALAADWSKTPTEHIKTEGLIARESHVQGATIARVAGDPSQIRPGYTAQILQLSDGRRVVIDGHNRVGIYHTRGDDLPAKIKHERDLIPPTKAKGRSNRAPVAGKRRKAAPPTGSRAARTARHKAAVESAQREMARRIVAAQGLGGRGATSTRVRRGGGIPSAGRDRGNAFGGIMRGSGLSSFATTPGKDIQLAVEFIEHDLDLGVFSEALHPRDFIGRFAKKGSLGGKERHEMRKAASEFLGRNSRASGYAKVKAATQAAREAETATDARKNAAEHARKVIAAASRNEPAITNDLKDVVAKAGGELENLKEHAATEGDHRLKTVDSLTRKIHDKAKQKYGTIPHEEGHAKYAGEVGDALRYTSVFDNATFVSDVNKMLDDLKKRGYTVDSVENTFKRGQAYAGVNMNLTAPNGQVWELQAHTPESIRAKHLIHDDYEIYRSQDPSISKAEKRAAYNRMVAVNRNLIRPSNFEKLGYQLHRPDHELHNEHLIEAAQTELYRRGLYKPRRGRRNLKRE